MTDINALLRVRVTIKQLQDTIKAKDLLIKDYLAWFDVLEKHIDRKNKTIKRKTARIKVLGKALAALERDYEALKRKKK
jgi:ferritin